MTEMRICTCAIAAFAVLSWTQFGFSQADSEGEMPLFNPPPFEMDGLPFLDGGLLLAPPLIAVEDEAEEEDDENAPPKWEASTLEAYEEAASDEYSDEYFIEFKNKSWHTVPCTRDMPRQRDGMLYYHYMDIDVFVRKEGEPYLKHGTNQKHPDVTPVPDPGIPLDAEPQMIIVFPPANPGDPEIVRQYPFKERC
jgi:hypothetical protein